MAAADAPCRRRGDRGVPVRRDHRRRSPASADGHPRRLPRAGKYHHRPWRRTDGSQSARTRQRRCRCHQPHRDRPPRSPPPTNNAGPDIDPAIIQRVQETPIDINVGDPRGETTYSSTPDGHVATATGDVSIVTNDAAIYCDRVEYNVDTHVALLIGNVRIFRNDTSIIAERAVYNFNTKAIRALDFHGHPPAVQFRGGRRVLTRPGVAGIQPAQFLPSPRMRSSKSDFHLRFAPHPRLPGQPRHLHRLDARTSAQTPVFLLPVLLPVARRAERLPVHAGLFEHQRRISPRRADLSHHRAPDRARPRFDYRSARGRGAAG